MNRLIAFAALAALALDAAAGYPEKPVRLVLPYGPGGGSDHLRPCRPRDAPLRPARGTSFPHRRMAGAHVIAPTCR